MTQSIMRHPNPRALAAHLARGGLIAYPTESCYGLGCDPSNYRAVQRLLRLKQRPQHKGLILIASRYAQVDRYLQPLATEAQLQAAGKEVITYLMPTRTTAPRHLRGKHSTLAVRFTAHPFAQQLCRQFPHALVSTSANRSGCRSIKTYAECQRQFGRQVWVLRGQIGKRKSPSSIRYWDSNIKLRG
jgi:L-threonylcarbamoyladenylate synthase